MGKLAKAEELRERILDRVEAFSDASDSLEEARKEARYYNEALARLRETPKLKRKGNFLIVLAVLLIVVEILALTETFITGYSDFDTSDVAIIAVVLLWGIIRKAKGMKEYRRIMQNSVSQKELQKKLEEAEAEIKKNEAVTAKYHQAQEDLENYIAYHGRDWDLTAVRLTDREMQQLEKDLPDLMLKIAYTSHYNFIYDNWFCMHCMEALTSNLTHNTENSAAFQAVRNKLGGSKSWILVATSLAMSVFELEVMHRQFNDGDSMDMDKALAMSQAGPPRNEAEKEYFELLKMAVPNMVNVVVSKLRSYQ